MCSLETPVTWHGNVCLAAWDNVSKAPSLKPHFLSSLLTESCKFYLNASSTPKPKSLPLSGDMATYSFNFIPPVKAICWMLSYKLDYHIHTSSKSENLTSSCIFDAPNDVSTVVPIIPDVKFDIEKVKQSHRNPPHQQTCSALFYL